jgi:hypothetical protein
MSAGSAVILLDSVGCWALLLAWARVERVDATLCCDEREEVLRVERVETTLVLTLSSSSPNPFIKA